MGTAEALPFFRGNNLILPFLCLPLIIQKGTTQKLKQTRTSSQTTEKLQIFLSSSKRPLKWPLPYTLIATLPFSTDLNFPFSFSVRRRSNPNV